MSGLRSPMLLLAAGGQLRTPQHVPISRSRPFARRVPSSPGPNGDGLVHPGILTPRCQRSRSVTNFATRFRGRRCSATLGDGSICLLGRWAELPSQHVEAPRHLLARQHQPNPQARERQREREAHAVPLLERLLGVEPGRAQSSGATSDSECRTASSVGLRMAIGITRILSRSKGSQLSAVPAGPAE